VLDYTVTFQRPGGKPEQVAFAAESPELAVGRVRARVPEAEVTRLQVLDRRVLVDVPVPGAPNAIEADALYSVEDLQRILQCSERGVYNALDAVSGM
jgi:hypothetical protein